MQMRAIASSLCVLPLLAVSATAMPTADEAASTFTKLAVHLPCQPDISNVATEIGFHEVGRTVIDRDYADIEYSDAANQTQLTVSFEYTPVGSQYSVLMDIPNTDGAYLETIVTALRQNWSLPQAVQVQNLSSGTAQFWTLELPKGIAQITVHHDNMTTHISGTLEPQIRGLPLPC